jgi:hypothetical protein
MAQYSISVNMPDVPKGEPVEFAHLGVFENGGTYNLAADRVELWQTCVSGGHDPETFKIEEAMFPEGVEIRTDAPVAKASKSASVDDKPKEG